jgi:hypothetical protein
MTEDKHPDHDDWFHRWGWYALPTVCILALIALAVLLLR